MYSLPYTHCWCLVQTASIFSSGVGYWIHSEGSLVTWGHTREERRCSLDRDRSNEGNMSRICRGNSDRVNSLKKGCWLDLSINNVRACNHQRKMYMQLLYTSTCLYIYSYYSTCTCMDKLATVLMCYYNVSIDEKYTCNYIRTSVQLRKVVLRLCVTTVWIMARRRENNYVDHKGSSTCTIYTVHVIMYHIHIFQHRPL